MGLLGPAVLTLPVIASPEAGWAQAQLASIAGVVTNQLTGQPIAAVTVVVTGPALQGPESELSDEQGRYLITQLPPGEDYQVRFYLGGVEQPRSVRSGIRLSQGKTMTVHAQLARSESAGELQVIRESAPNVDTASATIGIELNQELLQNTPVRGRSVESVLFLTPGAADVAPRLFGNVPFGVSGGEVGVSLSGATGNENGYMIDGMSTSDPNRGLIGSELSQYFVKEVSVLSGGYPAEYGRATGGIVNVATKSGSNEFHGSIFGSLRPYQLPAPAVARLGEALSLRDQTQLLLDFGFDLGGYLLKDHVWFYLGFAPTFTRLSTQRQVRQQLYDATTGKAQVDPSFACPAYLADSLYCLGPQRVALATEELAGAGRELQRDKHLYNVLAKLDIAINPEHRFTLSYLASPTTYEDYRLIPGQTVEVDLQKYSRVDELHDLNFRYLGKLLARRLQLDVRYGYHYQRIAESAENPATPFSIYLADSANPYSLADFEDVPACRVQLPSDSGTQRRFNPCPLTQYQRGFGYLQRDYFSQRHMLLSAATAYVHADSKWNPLRGVHALKLGFDFELSTADNVRGVTGTDQDPRDPTSGHRSYFAIADGSMVRYNQSAQRDVPNCKTPLASDKTICLLEQFRGLTQTRNFTLYLRDSWQVAWAPGLVVNLGLRWEAQELYGMALPTDPDNPKLGDKAIAIYDNWAPRMGLVYDFTQRTKHPGRGKLFVNYGRYYESIPMAVNDRQLTGEGFYASNFSSSCPDINPQGHRVPNVTSPDCKYPPGILVGGTPARVAPGLRGQYVNEIVAGVSYDLGIDLVAGLSYVHRDLGNIIEDVSTDGGRSYFIANPGRSADSAAAVGVLFARPRRDYDALLFTLSKRLSYRFSLIGSYSYSRSIGNYPGTYNSTKGQLEPNQSTQYDLTDLLANRSGPLPTDRPHNLKLTGFFAQPVREKLKLTFGLTFTAISGRPIDVLGAHLYYGANEVFILPRGSGGRTPLVTQLDLHLGYDHKLSQRVNLALYLDVINLLNQRQVTNVEDSYTFDPVSAISSGKPADLKHLRTVMGTPPSINSNYGQPTGYQEPLYLRVGGRLSF